MRLSQALAYLDEPTKPTTDQLLRYTHIEITEALEKARKRRRGTDEGSKEKRARQAGGQESPPRRALPRHRS